MQHLTRRNLSDDVRLLGDTLGDVLRSQGGDALFHTVERMRMLAKQARVLAGEEDALVDEDAHAVQSRRRHDDESVGAGLSFGESAPEEALAACAEGLSPSEALEVARAFTSYFQLINVAEDVHRARVLRARLKEGGAASVPESFHEVISTLLGQGMSEASLLAIFEDVRVDYVLTAHPTEARRRTTERLLAGVRESLDTLDRLSLTPIDEDRLTRCLRGQVEALWLHASERQRKPEVLDEVKAGLWYVRHVVMDAVPRVYRRLWKALDASGVHRDILDLPTMFAFGSWMGGDRDGHPFVTDAVTERTLEMHRWIAVERYVKDLESFVDLVAVASERLRDEDGALEELLRRCALAVPEVARLVQHRNPDEPLRMLVAYMIERLQRARALRPGAYVDAREFLADLSVLRQTLKASGGASLAEDGVVDVMLRARTFGFHFVALEFRQDSREHRKALGDLLGDATYPTSDDAARCAALDELMRESDGASRGRGDDRGARCKLRNAVTWGSGFGSDARDGAPASRHEDTLTLLGNFETFRRMQGRYGQDALHTYIISMTEGPADVLEVYVLAKAHGFAGTLDIVPLFETKDALDAGAQCLSKLFAHPVYRNHLRGRGDVQEVLVGYSDSMKENGILASRAAILHAQEEIAEVGRTWGIRIRFFHGRGGSVSRGGGPTYRAMEALPASVSSGLCKITEQGETRSYHFANPDLSVRYIEQVQGAAISMRAKGHAFELSRQNLGAPSSAHGVATIDLSNTAVANTARAAAEEDALPQATSTDVSLDAAPAARRRVLHFLAAASREKYRGLIQRDALVQYFVEATPFEAITGLPIASRPSKRRGQRMGIADLRAIPWVFAWAQSRLLMTAWYGVGSACEEANRDPSKQRALQALAQHDAFFRDLLANVEMTLAKADLDIARRYAALCSDPEVAKEILGDILGEYERTVKALLQLLGETKLLDHDPVLQRSIRLRNPYVDPLSYLQVSAIAKGRNASDPAEREAWQRVARLAVQGISAGLRNTG